MILFDTDLGACGIEWNDRGVTHVSLPGPQLAGTPLDEVADVPAAIRETIARIVALLAGGADDLRDVPLDETGIDDFRRAVYAATRAVGPGETASYGAIAKAIGRPDAARAVGAALGSNPFPIVVPCHRVIASTGELTGFSAPGGVATKRRMLQVEGAPGFRQQALFG
jgi:methylated-DNA-[protein]-cysteine S-methyltransferase